MLIALSLVPAVVARATAPAGFAYVGFVVGGEDVNLYYSFVRQARDGRWTFANHHTTAPHSAALINLQWLAMGRLGRVTGWSDEAVDTVWRSAGIATLCAAVWALLGRFVREAAPRKLALIVFAFGGGAGWIFTLLRRANIDLAWDYPSARGGVSSVPYDVFAGLPFHTAFGALHVMSFALLALAVLLLVRALETGRAPIGSGLCGIALALSHPYEALTLVATSALLVGMGRRAAVLPLVMTSVGLVYWIVLLALVPAFRWSVTFAPMSPLHTLVALGAVAVLALWTFPGAAADVRGAAAPLQVAVALLVANVVLYYGYPVVPNALAYRTTLMLPLLLVAMIRADTWWPNVRRTRLGLALVAAVVLLSLGSPALSVVARVREAARPRDGRYLIDVRFAALLDWLQQHTAPPDAVVAPPDIAHWIPARAGNAVFLGSRGVPRDWDSRAAEVRRLYDGHGEGAAAWLTRHRIRYVVATPNVPAPGGPFLVERYAAGGYGVYEFVPRVVSGQNASHER